jgi:hypothetical protein
LSEQEALSKIGSMPRHTTTAMRLSATNRLESTMARADEEDPQAQIVFDSSWHTSSYELMQGLDVVEHPAAGGTFAESIPALNQASSKQA